MDRRLKKLSRALETKLSGIEKMSIKDVDKFIAKQFAEVFTPNWQGLLLREMRGFSPVCAKDEFLSEREKEMADLFCDTVDIISDYFNARFLAASWGNWETSACGGIAVRRKAGESDEFGWLTGVHLIKFRYTSEDPVVLKFVWG